MIIIKNDKKGRIIMSKKITAVLLSILMIISSMGIVSFAACKTEKPFENSEFYTIGDYTIHYREFEVENEKGQIFLLHGFGLSTYTFEFIIKELNAMGYTCVAADIPSFGYSSRETFDTDFMSREELMYSLMTSLNDDSWILAGHSMGGGVALNMATIYESEGRIESLILFCPAAMNGMPQMPVNSLGSILMATAFEIFFRIGTLFRFPFVSLLDMSVVDDEFCEGYDIDQIRKPLQTKGTGRSISISSSHATATDFEAVAKLEMPSLLFTAEFDNVVTDTSDIANALGATGKLTSYEVAGGGHMAHENKAAEMAGVIDEFLS